MHAHSIGWLICLLIPTVADNDAGRRAAIAAVLDDWHQAAAAADEVRYFKHLSPDAVFLGTDATERWPFEEFRKYVHPHFSKGRGWKFRSLRRVVTLSKDGQVAWFDEDLATEKLGPCRGSGVLVADGQSWKIAHYVLSVPVPNEVFADVRKIIEAALEATKTPVEPKKPGSAPALPQCDSTRHIQVQAALAGVLRV